MIWLDVQIWRYDRIYWYWSDDRIRLYDPMMVSDEMIWWYDPMICPIWWYDWMNMIQSDDMIRCCDPMWRCDPMIWSNLTISSDVMIRWYDPIWWLSYQMIWSNLMIWSDHMIWSSDLIQCCYLMIRSDPFYMIRWYDSIVANCVQSNDMVLKSCVISSRMYIIREFTFEI